MGKQITIMMAVLTVALFLATPLAPAVDAETKAGFLLSTDKMTNEQYETLQGNAHFYAHMPLLAKVVLNDYCNYEMTYEIEEYTIGALSTLDGAKQSLEKIEKYSVNIEEKYTCHTSSNAQFIESPSDIRLEMDPIYKDCGVLAKGDKIVVKTTKTVETSVTTNSTSKSTGSSFYISEANIARLERVISESEVIYSPATGSAVTFDTFYDASYRIDTFQTYSDYDSKTSKATKNESVNYTMGNYNIHYTYGSETREGIFWTLKGFDYDSTDVIIPLYSEKDFEKDATTDEILKNSFKSTAPKDLNKYLSDEFGSDYTTETSKVESRMSQKIDVSTSPSGDPAKPLVLMILLAAIGVTAVAYILLSRVGISIGRKSP